MRGLLIVFFMCIAISLGFGQSSKLTYEVGTITEVTHHDPDSARDSGTAAYDISVRVGNIVYVVLYTLPPGKLNPKYRAGMELPVLVGSKTIRFNDMRGHPVEVPILRHKTVDQQSSHN